MSNSLKVPQGGEEIPHVVKFRCWHKVRRDMRPCSLAADDAGVVTHVVLGGVRVPLDDVVLMQFTGYADAEGTDIYDGDVLRGESDTEDGDEHRQVYWGHFEDCCIHGHTWLLTGDKWENSVYDHNEYMVVMGNAYQGVSHV